MSVTLLRDTPTSNLLETDAPYLTPAPYRVPNASFYLPFIAEKVAELKDVDTMSCSVSRELIFQLFF